MLIYQMVIWYLFLGRPSKSTYFSLCTDRRSFVSSQLKELVFAFPSHVLSHGSVYSKCNDQCHCKQYNDCEGSPIPALPYFGWASYYKLPRWLFRCTKFCSRRCSPGPRSMSWGFVWNRWRTSRISDKWTGCQVRHSAKHWMNLWMYGCGGIEVKHQEIQDLLCEIFSSRNGCVWKWCMSTK